MESVPLADGAPIESNNLQDDVENEEDESLLAVKFQNPHPFPTISIDTKYTGILDIDSHPSRPLIAAGLVDGSIKLFHYSEESSSETFSREEFHMSGCRSVIFSNDGRLWLTASSDTTIGIFDVEKQTLIHRVADAHEDGVNVIAMYDENTLASGDDTGGIRIWDIRDAYSKTNLTKFRPRVDKKEHSEYISAFCAVPQKSTLLATGGDGRLSVYDIRSNFIGLNALSDDIEDELLSISLIRNESMLVCGSGNGVLQFFKWGDFGDICDRYPGHPGSIDSILTVPDEANVILTGCGDGLIRRVRLFEHSLEKVIGKHGKLPVEKLCWSFDKQCIISAGHDTLIKFWRGDGMDISKEEDVDGDDDEEEEEEEEEDEDEEDDEDEEGDEEDDDDSSDDEPIAKQTKTKKGMSASGFRKASKKIDSMDFFSGL